MQGLLLNLRCSSALGLPLVPRFHATLFLPGLQPSADNFREFDPTPPAPSKYDVRSGPVFTGSSERRLRCGNRLGLLAED